MLNCASAHLLLSFVRLYVSVFGYMEDDILFNNRRITTAVLIVQKKMSRREREAHHQTYCLYNYKNINNGEEEKKFPVYIFTFTFFWLVVAASSSPCTQTVLHKHREREREIRVVVREAISKEDLGNNQISAFLIRVNLPSYILSLLFFFFVVAIFLVNLFKCFSALKRRTAVTDISVANSFVFISLSP